MIYVAAPSLRHGIQNIDLEVFLFVFTTCQSLGLRLSRDKPGWINMSYDDFLTDKTAFLFCCFFVLLSSMKRESPD